MSFLFSKGSKVAKVSDLVKSIKDALAAMEKKDKGSDKRRLEGQTRKDRVADARIFSRFTNLLAEEISKNLVIMKAVFYGEGEQEPNQDQITQLANEIYAQDLIAIIVNNMSKLEFEAKKDLATIFNVLLRRQVGARSPTVEYIARNAGIIEGLLAGYENGDIALNCGTMLRECIRHEALSRLMLYTESFFKFFEYVELTNFDIASDAFATFKDLLTVHKPLVAEFFDTSYDLFFEHYTELLNSENYVTKRQSLKLLGELLLDRANFNIMTRYISHSSNLKLMMVLLRDKSKSIQFEAFHVFKVFVANPNKPKPILEILQKNKEKLIKFLSKFHQDRDDEQFTEEKNYLLKQIEAL